MKTIKLKPLNLKSNEILVKPPDFLSESFEYPLKNSSMMLSSIEDLKTVLRNRKKNATSCKRVYINEEKESVERLSEFKHNPRKFTKSPLSRVSFLKRTLSNFNTRNNSIKHSFPERVEKIVPTFESILNFITGSEKKKNKQLELEMIQFRARNNEYQESLENRIKEVYAKIEKAGKEIIKMKVKINKTKEEVSNLEKLYKVDMNNNSYQNTENTLSIYFINGKKKTQMDVNEERNYFLLKQKLREAKKDLHEKYIASVENAQEKSRRYKQVLDNLYEARLQYQREIEELQEMLLLFFCKALKDGVDLRDDGIRWCIKAIWNISQPVPLSSFPSFVDEESAHFLLTVSKIDLEVEDLNKELQNYRGQIKKEEIEQQTPKSPTEHFSLVKSRLKCISQKHKIELAKAEKIFGYQDKIVFENTLDKYSEISIIKEKIKEKEQEKTERSSAEVRRVVGKFKNDDHNLGILHVIRALVGNQLKQFRTLTYSKKR